MADILDEMYKEGLSVAKFLNARDMVTETTFPHDINAMFTACVAGNLAVIRTLLAAGARADLHHRTRRTCAMEAIHHGDLNLNSDLRRQITELLSRRNPMPPCESGYRSVVTDAHLRLQYHSPPKKK